jgi:ubiquinone biosynthesis protein COQ4
MTKLDFTVRWREAFNLGIAILKDHTKIQYILALAHALNGPALKKSYERLLTTAEGGEIACDMPEFTDLYSKLPDCDIGTVGNVLLTHQKYPLEAVIKFSQRGKKNRAWINMKHPYVWMSRRYRDTHDLFHTLTGYRMDTFGEAVLTAFSYAQTGALQWGFLVLVGFVKVKFHPLKIAAIIEGYRRGKKAKWILGENFETMIYEDLEECRERLNLSKAKWYEKACKN